MKTATEKTYRAINLKTWEVLAILDGTLTELRRVFTEQPPEDFACCVTEPDKSNHWLFIKKFNGRRQFLPENYWVSPPSPFGNVGEILWGRETWQKLRPYGYLRIFYQATPDEEVPIQKWQPSTQMPREFCRIFLEVKRQRVERVQDMTWEAALADGNGNCGVSALKFAPDYWDADNKKPEHKWGANPWVFVTEIERIEANAI